MSDKKPVELRVSVDVGYRRHSVAIGLPSGEGYRRCPRAEFSAVVQIAIDPKRASPMQIARSCRKFFWFILQIPDQSGII